jgi:hypothetical protein
MASSTCNWRPAARVVAVLALLASARSARAASGPPADGAAAKVAAEAKLTEGVELLKTRHDGEALRRFEQAYALVPSPLIFYDFGLAHLGLGDDARALESFDRFLAEAPDAPADKRLKAEQHRDELRPRVSIVALEANVAAAELTVDGVARGHVSFPRRLYLAPGPHQLVARADGATQAMTISCVAGQTLPLAFRLPPPAPPSLGAAAREAPTLAIAGAPVEERPPPASRVEVLQAPLPVSSDGWVRPAALSAAAAGVVSMGVGLGFGLAARSDGEEVTGEAQNRMTYTPDTASAGMRDQRLETVFLAVGAAAVAAGVGLYLWARHHGGGARPAEAAP